MLYQNHCSGVARIAASKRERTSRVMRASSASRSAAGSGRSVGKNSISKRRHATRRITSGTTGAPAWMASSAIPRARFAVPPRNGTASAGVRERVSGRIAKTWPRRMRRSISR